MIVNAVLSALLNLLVLAGFPFLFYFAWQKWKWKRPFREIVQRAGLQLGAVRYIGYSLAFAIVSVAVVAAWLPAERLAREGSAGRQFVGLGLGGTSITLALLYGVIKTGFSEEFLFRGLIAGSLSRRLPIAWANVVQAFIFLIPHLFLLLIMPNMWGFLIVVFAGALFLGWVRIKSGSILGPWLIHASLNVTMGLGVAIGTAP